MTKPLNPTGKKHRFSKQWVHDQANDHWVKESQRLGYRSRSAFKLLELAEKDKLLRPGMRVVDLGSAPGSWCQVLAQKVGPAGTLVAIDLLPMEPVRGVSLLQGDFATDEGLAAVAAALNGAKVDLVVSDMSPNLSGIEGVDQSRAVHLADLALDLAVSWLRPGGDFVVKAFQGSGLDEFTRQVQERFLKTYVRKPKASRERSREIFIVGKGLRGGPAANRAVEPKEG